MKKEIKDSCKKIYKETIEFELDLDNKGKNLTKKQLDNLKIQAQKKAIMFTAVSILRLYPELTPAEVWKEVYAIHVSYKSGIDDNETIKKVISADQSWKKSSGHAFEEMIKKLGNDALVDTNIEILLQRDLHELLTKELISNESRDINWLKEQVKADIFDLYILVNFNNKKYCFGCIQSKTSIRDRVTRDREPSIIAMNNFFWSIVIVLDDDFLKNQKFIGMVNGGTTEHPTNGWHGMYVMSDKKYAGRIYNTDFSLEILREHAIAAAEYWLTQRQWFNKDWKA